MMDFVDESMDFLDESMDFLDESMDFLDYMCFFAIFGSVSLDTTNLRKNS